MPISKRSEVIAGLESAIAALGLQFGVGLKTETSSKSDVPCYLHPSADFSGDRWINSAGFQDAVSMDRVFIHLATPMEIVGQLVQCSLYLAASREEGDYKYGAQRSGMGRFLPRGPGKKDSTLRSDLAAADIPLRLTCTKTDRMRAEPTKKSDPRVVKAVEIIAGIKASYHVYLGEGVTVKQVRQDQKDKQAADAEREAQSKKDRKAGFVSFSCKMQEADVEAIYAIIEARGLDKKDPKDKGKVIASLLNSVSLESVVTPEVKATGTDG